MFRLTDRPDMTIAVDWDAKQLTKPKSMYLNLDSIMYIY